MKNALTKTTAMALLMSIAPSIFAQSSYNGSITDLNAIYNPPSNINGLLCDSTNSDGKAHSYKACSDGVNAANKMAEKYAANAGAYVGCMDGFYQGIWDGYLSGKNPSGDMMAQAQARYSQVTMQTAMQRAEQRGNDDSESVAASQIIARHKRVIGRVDPQTGTQMQPDDTYDHPEVRFFGYDGGYNHDITNGQVTGINFGDVTSNGWVQSNSPFEDKLAASSIYRLQGAHGKSVCDNSTTIFGRRDMPQLTIWDYWRARRKYRFEKYGWNNADWTWGYFLNDGDIHDYQNYKNIETLTKKVTVRIEVKPAVTRNETQFVRDAAGNKIPVMDAATGQQRVDANGNLVWKTKVVVVVVTPAVFENRQVDQKLSAAEVADLRKMFQNSFKTSYSRHYARQYASLNYAKAGQQSYSTSRMIGQLVGEKVAVETANQIAYDQRYKTVSASKYAEVIKKNYEVSFDEMFNKFRNHPIVELNSVRVSGEVNDGIFRPGERLAADIKITNIGQKAGTVRFNLLDNQNVRSLGQYVFTPQALASATYKTDYMGQISLDTPIRPSVSASSNVNDRTKIGMQFEVAGNVLISDIQRELKTAENITMGLNEVAEISGISTDLDVMSGNIGMRVSVKNPSTMETSAFPRVNVQVTGYNIQDSVDMDKIRGNETKKAAVAFSQLDPLEIINRGAITGRVQTMMNGRVLDQKEFAARIAGNKMNNVAKYYHALINGDTQNSGNDGMGVRVNKLIGMVDTYVNEALASRTKWNKSYDVEDTIVASLARNYASANASGTLSTSAKEMYTQLAKMLAKKISIKGSQRVRRKKHYLLALKKFAPSLSTKKRDHKVGK